MIARFGGVDFRSDTGALLTSVGIPGSGYVTSAARLADGRIVAVDFTNGKFYVIGQDGSVSAGVPTVSQPLTVCALPSGGFLVAGTGSSINRYDAGLNLVRTYAGRLGMYGLTVVPDESKCYFTDGSLYEINLTTGVYTFLFNQTTGLGGLEHVAGHPNLPGGTMLVCTEAAGPLLLNSTLGVIARYTGPGVTGLLDSTVLPNGSIVGCSPSGNSCTIFDAAGNVASTFAASVFPYNVAYIAAEDVPDTCVNSVSPLTVNTSPGTCSATVNEAAQFHLCPGWSFVGGAIGATANLEESLTPAGGSGTPGEAVEYAIGTHDTIFTISNGSQFQSLKLTVTVQDKEAPVVISPGDFKLDLPDGETTVQANYTVTATDNCGGTLPVTCSIPSGTFLGIGTHTVVCVASDVSGNTRTDSFTITVEEPAGGQITWVHANQDGQGAFAYFSKVIDAEEANKAANYVIDGGITVTSAELFDGRVVYLAFNPPLPQNSTHTLTVNPQKIPLSQNEYTFQTDGTGPAEPVVPGIANLQIWSGQFNNLDEVRAATENRPADQHIGLASLETPVNRTDYYGGWLRAFITPPETGLYAFHFGSDDDGELWLSTDANPANKVLIARESVWGSPRDWGKCCGNHSEEFEGSQWPGGSPIGLTAGNRYYLEALWREGQGGDFANVNISRFGGPSPANNTRTLLTRDWIGWYSDPLVAPVITDPPQDVEFPRGGDIEFNVSSWSPLPQTFQWYLNKVPIPGAIGPTLTIPNATTVHIGDYSVEVSNANGVTHTHLNDARAQQIGGSVLYVGAADFNNNGNHEPAASQPNYRGGAYAGQGATFDIDYNDNGDQTGGDPNAFVYRGFHPDDANVVEIGQGSNDPNDLDKGEFTVEANYNLGWTDGGEWLNYTRIFPAATYNAFGEFTKDGFAWNGPNDPNGFSATLYEVSNPRTPDGSQEHFVGGQQGLDFLGDTWFPGTGNWSSFDLVPFNDSSGNPAQISLAGERTVRLVMKNFGDFTGLRFYMVAPYVSDLADQTTAEGTPLTVTFTTENNAFTVSGVEVVADNTELFPDGSITVASEGGTHTLTLTPAQNQSGSTKVTVKILSDGETVIRTFTVTVTPLIEVPQLAGQFTFDAVMILEAANLKAGNVVQVYHPTVAPGKVVGTDPSAGTLVGADTEVTIFESKGREPVITELRTVVRNGREYILLGKSDGSGVSAVEAQAYAVARGGFNLVAINDAEEQAWIEQEFADCPYIWIGATDEANEDTFGWYSDEPFLYTNWQPNEPNNFGGVEDHTLIVNIGDAPGLWNDSQGSLNQIGGVPTYALIESGPAISPVADFSMKEDGQVTIPVWVSELNDGRPLVAWSDNPMLFPEGSLVVAPDPAGRPNNYTLYLTPALNANGQSKITLTVSHPEHGTATEEFELTVTPVNDAPVAKTVQLVGPYSGQVLQLVSDGSGEPPVIKVPEDGNLGPDGNSQPWVLRWGGVGPGGGSDEGTTQQTQATAETDNPGLLGGFIFNPPVLLPGQTQTDLFFTTAENTSGEGTLNIRLDDGQPGGSSLYPIKVVVEPAGKVVVPDVEGETPAVAVAVIKQANLKLGEEIQVYHETMPAGYVIRTSPAAGTEVDADTFIHVYISKGPEPFGDLAVTMEGPSEALVGETIFYTIVAANLGETDGHDVYLDIEIQDNFEILGRVAPPGLVLEGDRQMRCLIGEMPSGMTLTFKLMGKLDTSIMHYNSNARINGNVQRDQNPGNDVDYFSTVAMSVVPTVVELRLEQATPVIKAAGFIVGEKSEAHHETIPAGGIVSQEPSAGIRAQTGSSINLVISLGPKRTEPPVVTVVNPETSQQSVQQSDPIEPVKLRVVDSDSASDQVLPGFKFTINGGTENPGLPNGLQLNPQEATPPGEVPSEATFWLEGKALVVPGTVKIQVYFTDETGNQTTAPTVEVNVAKETGFQIDLLDAEQTLRTPGAIDTFTGFKVSGKPVGRPRNGNQAYRVTISDTGNVQKHSQQEWFFANVDETTDLSSLLTLQGETSGKIEIVKDYQMGWADQAIYFQTGHMFFQPEGPGTPSIVNADGEEGGVPFFNVNSGPKPREQWNIRVEVGGAEGPVRFNAWLGRTALNLGGTELHVGGTVRIQDTDGSPLPNFSGYQLYADLPSRTQGPWDIFGDPVGLGTGWANPTVILGTTDFLNSQPTLPPPDISLLFRAE